MMPKIANREIPSQKIAKTFLQDPFRYDAFSTWNHPQDPQNSGYLFLATDYQNSIWAVMDQGGNIREEMAYDPWGNRRDATTGNPTYLPGTSGQQSFSGLLFRGYTLHEHLDIFGLINMNGRLYAPQLGRMLSPDNFVQNPSSTQNFNRYSYVLNNPLKYTDPSGELIFTLAALVAAPFTGGASLGLLPYTIGADLGALQGGSIANGTMNPFQWDYSSGKTWGYMADGLVVGAASGGVANAVATSGIPLANTAAFVSGSYINSVGMHMITGGQTDVSVSFGFGSYNFSTGEFGYLGKKGNSTLENIGYSLGALANIGDFWGIHTDAKAAKHAANKGKPIDVPNNFDPVKAWKVLGTKEGYNYYGPSKTGWDPEMIRYSMIKGGELSPLNELDRLAYLHDVAHYNNGTEGLMSSLFSTNRATIASDFALARGAVSILRSGATGSIARTALTTSMGMYFLGGMHTMAANSYYWPMMYNY